jgi:hypothetical protein
LEDELWLVKTQAGWKMSFGWLKHKQAGRWALTG